MKRLALAFVLAAPLVAYGLAGAYAVETVKTDGGRIKIRKTYKDGSAIKFCMSKSRSTSGLRSLKLFDKNGVGLAVIEVSDASPGPVCATFQRKDLLQGFRFELFKRTLAVFNLYLAGTDVAYPGAPPLDRMDFHWLDG